MTFKEMDIMDAIQWMRTDHAALERLLDQSTKTACGRELRENLSRLYLEWRTQKDVRERVLYRMVSQTSELKPILDEACAQSVVIGTLFAEVQRIQDSEEILDHADRIRVALREHLAREGQFARQIAKHLSSVEIHQLGLLMSDLREELELRPSEDRISAAAA